MFSKCDREGKWAWTKLRESPDKFLKVIEKLQDFETMNWDQNEAAGNHPIDIEGISREAQNRLKHIGRDETVDLMSFRITSKKRVWCARDSSQVMKILWWNPNHTVYPTTKRNT